MHYIMAITDCDTILVTEELRYIQSMIELYLDYQGILFERVTIELESMEDK